jgi:hypothetical protein
MDYTKFDNLPNEQATVLMADVRDALKDDHEARGERFNITPFNDEVASRYDLRNKTALRYGYNTGKKIREGKPLKQGKGLIHGSDVARVISYALREQGRLAWPHLKTLIADRGKPWTDLLEIEPEDQQQQIDDHVKRAVAGLEDSRRLAADLRRIAERVEPLAHRVTGLTDRLTDQAAALSNFVTADRRLRREITAFADQMDRLRRGMENETDPHRIQAAAEGMALLLDRLRKTLE